MSQYTEGPCKTIAEAGVFAKGLRVRFRNDPNSPLRLIAAGDIEIDFGVAEFANVDLVDRSWPNDNVKPPPLSVRLRTASGTHTMVAHGAITKGQKVYGAIGGRVSATANINIIGVANSDAEDESYVEVLRFRNIPSGLP